MSVLDRFAVVVETHDEASGMAPAILRELLDALNAYLETGTPYIVNLASLPLGPADRGALERALGQGEIDVRIDTLGTSRLRETAFAGIWWVRHEDVEGALLCEQIEITALPEILHTDRVDIETSAARLASLTVSGHRGPDHGS